MRTSPRTNMRGDDVYGADKPNSVSLATIAGGAIMYLGAYLRTRSSDSLWSAGLLETGKLEHTICVVPIFQHPEFRPPEYGLAQK